MTVLTNIFAFVFALGVIVFVHELGHLLVAKGFHVRVLAFSLGFGKRLFGFTRGETEYRVSAVPLGGYVRLGGENPDDELSDDPREFLNKPRWQRILVYLAGPAMNYVLSIVMVAVLFMVGTPLVSLPGQAEPVVRLIEEGSPAAAAGLEPGDRLVGLKGQPIDSWQDFAVTVSVSPEETLPLEVERDGERFSIELTPRKVEPYGFGDAGVYPELSPRIAQLVAGQPAESAGFQVEDEILTVDGRPIAGQADFIQYLEEHPGQEIVVGVTRAGVEHEVRVTPREVDGVGKIGAVIGAFHKFPPHRALAASLAFNWDLTVRTLDILGKVVTRQVAAKNVVSGPVDIASFSGAALRQGWEYLVYLMAVISVSIAIFNLLPIPLLDGGQVFILMVESIRGRDLSLPIKERIQQFGFLLIILLMSSVIILDIAKRIPDGVFGG